MNHSMSAAPCPACGDLDGCHEPAKHRLTGNAWLRWIAAQARAIEDAEARRLAALPTRIPLDRLLAVGYTFHEVDYWHKRGDVDSDTFDAWCWHFRDQTFRYSGIGKARARAHAERAGKSLPSSDREVTS